MPSGSSDFVHCHCNFLAGRSFRGVTHRRGITYRWLFVRMSLWVIICLVTCPSNGLFGQFFFTIPGFSTIQPLSTFVSNDASDIVAPNLERLDAARVHFNATSSFGEKGSTCMLPCCAFDVAFLLCLTFDN